MPLDNDPEIVWEDPPITHMGPRRKNEDPRWQQLREHPGKWCLWATGIVGAAVVRNRPGFEATSRRSRVVDGKRVHDVYVRYNPDAES